MSYTAFTWTALVTTKVGTYCTATTVKHVNEGSPKTFNVEILTGYKHLTIEQWSMTGVVRVERRHPVCGLGTNTGLVTSLWSDLPVFVMFTSSSPHLFRQVSAWQFLSVSGNQAKWQHQWRANLRSLASLPDCYSLNSPACILPVFSHCLPVNGLCLPWD